MRRWRAAMILAAAGTLGGCGGTSATLPYPREAVWQAAVGEALVWRPQVDEENHRITSTMSDMMGKTVFQYEVQVTEVLDWSGNRCGRVHVEANQIEPQSRPLKRAEDEFIARVANRLQSAAQTGK